MPNRSPRSMDVMRGEDKKNMKCPECGGEVDFDGTDLVCKKCGLVIDE